MEILNEFVTEGKIAPTFDKSYNISFQILPFRFEEERLNLLYESKPQNYFSFQSATIRFQKRTVYKNLTFPIQLVNILSSG